MFYIIVPDMSFVCFAVELRDRDPRTGHRRDQPAQPVAGDLARVASSGCIGGRSLFRGVRPRLHDAWGNHGGYFSCRDGHGSHRDRSGSVRDSGADRARRNGGKRESEGPV